MSLYAEYIKEREGLEICETDKGFAVYRFAGEECIIQDIFIATAFRESRLASDMADHISAIAKERGCKFLVGTVCPSAKYSDRSIKVLQGYGFRLHSAKENFIIFVKDL